MITDPDIDWLNEHRPASGDPSSATTERARASLLASARRERRRRRVGAATATTAVAAAAGAAIVLAGGAHSGSRAPASLAVVAPGATPRSIGTHAPGGTPLVRLAADVRTLPTPPQTGDATLVVRDTTVDGSTKTSNGEPYGGYDLYTDSGHYYYSPELSGLQQQVDENIDQGGDEAHVLAVLAAAASDSPTQARAAAMGTDPIYAKDADPDSVLWGVATQALAAGAGRPDVRAGAMQVLSSLKGVTETPDEVDGADALKVSFPVVTNGDEIIWLNANDGVPIQEQDLGASKTGFEVERVTAADLPSQISPDAQLR